MRGPCYSACTLLLAYVAPENLCIEAGAFMAFHAIRSAEYGQRLPAATFDYYTSMPTAVRRWINDNGGHENLPLDGYWTMHDSELVGDRLSEMQIMEGRQWPYPSCRHCEVHCNSWRNDHKGARAIVIPAPSAKVR